MGLLDFAQEKSKEIGNEILSGDVSINPYVKDGDNACDYCPYLSACQFDNVYNKYRYLGTINDDEFWEKVMAGKEGYGNE